MANAVGAIAVLRVLRQMGKESKIHESPAFYPAHQPNPPFQPTRVDVCRVHSGSFRAGG